MRNPSAARLAGEGREIPTDTALSHSRDLDGKNYISRASVENVLAGVAFAAQLGFPLNEYMVVRLPVGADHAPIRVAIMKSFGDWLRYWRVPPTYVWSVERRSAYGLHHLHLNALLHVPRGRRHRDFRWHVEGWVRSAGIDIDTRTVETKAIYNLDNLVRYILKGASPEVCDELLDFRHEHQGFVPGKRAGCSQNIDRAARTSGKFAA